MAGKRSVRENRDFLDPVFKCAILTAFLESIAFVKFNDRMDKKFLPMPSGHELDEVQDNTSVFPSTQPKQLYDKSISLAFLLILDAVRLGNYPATDEI